MNFRIVVNTMKRASNESSPVVKNFEANCIFFDRFKIIMAVDVEHSEMQANSVNISFSSTLYSSVYFLSNVAPEYLDPFFAKYEETLPF
jgi:hypothetical protein